jgi:hypothetical protein
VRIVDDAEPLMQHAERIHGVARGLLHGLADTVGHRIKPLGDGAGHFGLPSGESLPHGVDAPGSLALGAQHFAQALLEFVGADRLGHRQRGPAAAGSRNDDRDDKEQDERKHAKADQRCAGADRRGADHEKNLVHAALSIRFGLEHERRGNIYGKYRVNFLG